MADEEKFNDPRRVSAATVLTGCCIILATASLTLSTYQSVIIAQQGETIRHHAALLDRLLSDGLIDPTEQHKVKRSVDDFADDEASPKMETKTWIPPYLSGPPGRDGLTGRDGEPGAPGEPGRDGRDGRDCGNKDAAPADSYDALLTYINKTLEKHKPSHNISSPPSKTVGNGTGSIYTRWGRTTCGNHSELIYKGITASAHFTHAGGGVNYQCLPPNPDWDSPNPNLDTSAWIYGTEYEVAVGNGMLPDAVHNHNAPCARCLATARTASMMIPGKNTCPDSWTKEYSGYLMSAAFTNSHPSTFECVDKNPEYVSGQARNTDGALFYQVQFGCNAGNCPPYQQGWELTCAVCTK